ncbi:cysteine--tRNA ligase [Lactobacillus sp. DCY120]|uniref:Cysteine--tRNA ligase n=1 Tax=Bombilactobacillus apium TaxID=2675299 RepID=A0A850R5U3_9LACO|nr:cysteine--tRNA ligase [Bombilactobacillus apium]NVY95992.1 cysteine--tRNA ligase [Bombilactobacillus apium]
MLKIFNTLTKNKEEFVPQVAGQVKMYVCGPTVYNYIHLGNARSIVAFDTIRRYLEYRGYQVDYVSNFTDVGDKIIKAAQEQQLTSQQIADKYIAAYQADTKALNVQSATKSPRATENMVEIIDLIADLIARGFAYESAGDVYYRARKFKKYGQLSGQDLADLELGASQRVDVQDTAKKEDPIDFALWKKAPENEISWPSPWSKGRPGWHIECSAMANKYLGATVDIHAGGEDLIFPHHENEIAQSEVHTGQTFAHYWMHNGFVTIGEHGEKMSKSLHNFVTVHELLQQVDPQVLRFFMAATQYRRPVQYSQTSLADAQTKLQHFQTAAKNLYFRLQDEAFGDFDAQLAAEVTQLEQQFQEHMDDDFNVQNGLSDLYEMMRLVNNYVARDQVNRKSVEQLLNKFTELLGIFGLEFQFDNNVDQEVEGLIQERDQARADKDFQQSDQLRDQLRAMGIILEDTPQGTRWHKE